jgi:hypothetical protein
MRLIALIHATALSTLLAAPIPATAQEISHADIWQEVAGHKGVAVLDLVRLVAPDIAVTDGVARGNHLVQMRYVSGGDEVPPSPTGFEVSGISAIDVRSGGKDRVAALIEPGQVADTDEPLAVLALFDVSGTPRLLDAVDVALDRDTSLVESGRLDLGAGTDAILTRSSHFNSSQGYAATALVLLKDDRFELIDTVYTFDENVCSFERRQETAFKAVPKAGGMADIAATVTETTMPRDEGCDGEVPPAGTRTIAVTYGWDAASSRYEPDSDAFEVLARENETRF